jgi:hypothetical protein
MWYHHQDMVKRSSPGAEWMRLLNPGHPASKTVWQINLFSL